MKRGLILLLVTALVIVFVRNALIVHKPISLSSVESVEVYSKGSRAGQVLSDEEAAQIIRWFNSAYDVKNNPYHGAPGCGTHSSVVVHLKSGQEVSIVSYMRVTRGKPGADLEDLKADYYFKQPELEQYLRDWDAKADAMGC